MILSEARVIIEKNGFLAEKLFGVADLGMIFGILRSKLYSNPVLAVCREISCNARDAHREVGTPDLPIQITLPNTLDGNYRIKDWGPGISPDRMDNIFINYTASTKRGDNIQTGAFGLGSKSCWAISDSFTIVTTHNHIKYQYACYIDETKVGKLALLSQDKTTEPNGTEIVIPIEPNDFKLFNQWTEHALRHFIPSPIIKGGNLSWRKYEKVMSGSNWGVATRDTYDNESIKAIVDGIEYPISYDALRTYTDRTDMIDAMRGTLLLYFGVGELSLSASREQIYLDEPTKQVINDRLQQIFQVVKKTAQDKINDLPDLWQANLYYRKQLMEAFHDLRFLGTLTWKDIPLHNRSVSLGCPIFSFSKGKYVRKGGFDPNQIARSRVSHLCFDADYELYFNDLPAKTPTPSHVKKLFENNTNLKHIQVVSLSDKVTEEVLNAQYHFDQMLPKRLSSLIKVSKRAATPAASRLLVFKCDGKVKGYRQVSYASMDEDANHKVICLLRKHEYPLPVVRLSLLKSGQTISEYEMRDIARRDPDTSFYGVDAATPDKRVAEEFGDLESLDDYLDRQVIKNPSIDYVEIKYACNNGYKARGDLAQEVKTFDRLIKNKNSPFLRQVHLHHKITKLNAGDTSLLSIYEAIKGAISEDQINKFVVARPDYNFERLEQEVANKYPLLAELSPYQFRDTNVKHIAHYINLIDTHG